MTLLKYIEIVTVDLLLTCVLCTLIYRLADMIMGKKGTRIQTIGILVGVAAAAAMAVVKNTTKLIRTDDWNTWIFYIMIVFSVIYVISMLLSGRKAMAWISQIAGAVVSADLIFYELPDVIAYPYNFDIKDNSVWSAEFFTRLAGWALALLFLYILSQIFSRCIRQLGHKGLTKGLTATIVLVDLGRIFGFLLRNWISRGTRRWPYFVSKDHPWAFPFAKFVLNNERLFFYIALAVSVAVPLVLFIRSTKVRDPYDNPAQLRKLRARNRSRRRLSVGFGVCAVCAVLIMTVVHGLNNQVVTLSEPETYTFNEDKTQILVSIEDVNDGHLHRFEYTTSNKVDVRWIIVKKPNSGAYGIGLDACDVCGTAGYYERDGSVICKRCDVVMNINTIGFKGGCNPIPIDYTIENGYIIFEMSDILAAERSFK